MNRDTAEHHACLCMWVPGEGLRDEPRHIASPDCHLHWRDAVESDGWVRQPDPIWPKE